MGLHGGLLEGAPRMPAPPAQSLPGRRLQPAALTCAPLLVAPCLPLPQVASLWDELHTKQPWRNAVAAGADAKPIQPFPGEASAALLLSPAAVELLWRHLQTAALACATIVGSLAAPVRTTCCLFRLALWPLPAGRVTIAPPAGPHLQAAEEAAARQRAGNSSLVLFIGVNTVGACPGVAACSIAAVDEGLMARC